MAREEATHYQGFIMEKERGGGERERGGHAEILIVTSSLVANGSFSFRFSNIDPPSLAPCIPLSLPLFSSLPSYPRFCQIFLGHLQLI